MKEINIVNEEIKGNDDPIPYPVLFVSPEQNDSRVENIF